MLKICSKCKQEKEVKAFSKSKIEEYKLQYHCKACNKKYRLENKEKIKKYQKKYRKEVKRRNKNAKRNI